MNQNISILQSLGLSGEESRIYLALLGLGGCAASILAKEVGLKRTTVYPILHKLAEQGLVNIYFRKNKRFYYAEKPAKVAGLFHKKIESFESIIPVLESLDKKQAQMIGLRFIETIDELENFYFAILDEYRNKKYCAIGNANAWEGLNTDFFTQYRKDRAMHGIKTKLLLTEDSRKINPTDETLLREWKYLPKKYAFKSTMDIFDDKVLIISPKFSSLAVVIAVPAMVDIFKTIFEMLWDFTLTEKEKK
jgi:sugar-specific transcriptional regulator TrmB